MPVVGPKCSYAEDASLRLSSARSVTADRILHGAYIRLGKIGHLLHPLLV